MKIKILTLFPEMFGAVLNASILGRAQAAGHIQIECMDIRAFSADKHRRADDYPYGGGAGMVMSVQPIYEAMQAAMGTNFTGRRIYLSPRGSLLTQERAGQLAGLSELILLCGHYEGVDQRALDLCIDEELSIGDYVLTGGELPAMVLVDCIARLIPGVLGSSDSAEEESHSNGLLEYPQYTRPEVFLDRPVPPVLLSGHHLRIQEWRHEQSLAITQKNRPDLYAKICGDS